MKQRDNISGFEAMHLAMEDESLEIQYREWDEWASFGDIKLDDLDRIFLKGWSIRKRETNLDKAMKEIFDSHPAERVQAIHENPSDWVMKIERGTLRKLIAKYIKD